MKTKKARKRGRKDYEHCMRGERGGEKKGINGGGGGGRKKCQGRKDKIKVKTKGAGR